MAPPALPAHPSFHLLSPCCHSPHGNMHTQPASHLPLLPPRCCLEMRGMTAPKTFLSGDLLSLIVSFLTSWDINLSRWTQGLRWDNQAGLCLEAGLAWSSALSGRLSLAWYTSGQGLHVPAFLLFSITKQQEMGLRKGRHRKVSAALVLKHPQGREHLHSPRRMGHPSQVLGI